MIQARTRMTSRWLLALALIPLIVSLLTESEQPSIADRIACM